MHLPRQTTQQLVDSGRLQSVDLPNGDKVLRSAVPTSLEQLATRLDDELQPVISALSGDVPPSLLPKRSSSASREGMYVSLRRRPATSSGGM